MNQNRKRLLMCTSLAVIHGVALTGCASTGSGAAVKRAEIGTAHIQQGHDVLAEEQFRAILEEHPDDPVAHYEMGRIEALRGNAAEARMHFERVIQVQPYNASAHSDLGWSLVQLNLLSEAEKHFKRALELEDQEGLSWAGLGAISLGQHKPDRAFKELNRALSFNPRDPLAHYFLGRYFGEKGDRKRAMEHFKTCGAQENIMRGESYYELACCYADLNKGDAALNSLQQAARYGFLSVDRVKADARFKKFDREVNEIFKERGSYGRGDRK